MGYVAEDLGKVGSGFRGKDSCGGDGGYGGPPCGGGVGGRFSFSTLKTPFWKFKVSLE